MRVGNKKIFHLEAWVVKVMSLYKVRSLILSTLASAEIWTDPACTPAALLLRHRHERI